MDDFRDRAMMSRSSGPDFVNQPPIRVPVIRGAGAALAAHPV